MRADSRSTLRGAVAGNARSIPDTALNFDVDRVVMGAYGHTRARVLSGATRDPIADSNTPAWLAHSAVTSAIA